MVTGITPNWIITDDHDSYPRAIRKVLGKDVRHRDSQHLNNRLEQGHRGVKGRYSPMGEFKCPQSAGAFCRAYDELRNFLRAPVPVRKPPSTAAFTSFAVPQRS